MKSKGKAGGGLAAPDPHKQLRDEVAQLQSQIFGDWRCLHDGSSEPQFVRQQMELGSYPGMSLGKQFSQEFGSTNEGWRDPFQFDNNTSADNDLCDRSTSKGFGTSVMPTQVLQENVALRKQIQDIEQNFEQLLHITSEQQRKINQYQNLKNRKEQNKGADDQIYNGNLQDAIYDDYSRHLGELRSDLDAEVASRNSIYNSNHNTGGGPKPARKIKVGTRKKSCTKSITNRLPWVPSGKVSGRTIENSRMESSKQNHTFRQSQMFGDTMITDNISDITYRSKSFHRHKRGCCQEKDKILKKLENKNKRKASQVRDSSIIQARGGSGNGLGGGGTQVRNSSVFGTRSQNNMTMTTSEMPSIMQSQVKNSSNNSRNTRKVLSKNGDKSARLNNRKILENAQKSKKQDQYDERKSNKPSGFFLERSRSHNNIGDQIDLPVHQSLEISQQDQNLININTNTSASMFSMAPANNKPLVYDQGDHGLFTATQDLHSHASNQQNHGASAAAAAHHLLDHGAAPQYNVYTSLRNVSANSSNRLLQGAQWQQQANGRYRQQNEQQFLLE